MSTTLRADELALWHAWKRAAEAVRTRIAADIAAATGLSDPDFGVLTRVVELGGGRLRQCALAESMRFERSRLSHHLDRMAERGLVMRARGRGGVDVVATAAGRAAVTRARPVHASAVRRHLVGPLGRDAPALRAALERLAS